MKALSATGLVFLLFALVGFSLPAPAQNSDGYADLLDLFKAFRDFAGQGGPEDIAAYPAAMEQKLNDLRGYQSRLGAIDIDAWPIAEKVDFHLVRAEMNGLEFQLRVLKPWERNPSFYGGRGGGMPRLSGLPLQEDGVADLRARLQAVPRYYEQAKKNLGRGSISNIPGDLAILTLHYRGRRGGSSSDIAERLAEHHPELVADAESAQAAIDGYYRWLEDNKDRMTASAGVGLENYAWLMKNVYLFPYTWNDIRTIVELEDNRVITFLKLEENRNRNLPKLKPVDNSEDYQRSVLASVDRVMDFIRDEEIFTIPEYLSEDRYRAGRERSTSRPWPEKHDYFYVFSHRESLMEETHEMVGHNFDVQRQQNDNRPIRGARQHEGPYYMAVARLEGLAFAFEELFMHAGYLDDRPQQAREITYEQAAFRTVRALADVYMHSGDWSLTDAMEYAVANAPYGDRLDDSPHLWGEMQSTLLMVGWHSQMVVGKTHFMKLLRDRAQQLGDDFVLRDFMDEFYAAGVIPTSLIRWEMTGYDDEIKKLW